MSKYNYTHIQEFLAEIEEMIAGGKVRGKYRNTLALRISMW